ncbi:MAG: bifunctional phosphoribosyl-AMP cyclohydrolase/phosphoribosyl-ATP diphosphatase HisIE [Lachnospiraceae bacterium]|nr:bifunctional phosphoribosyl-AMP cyclohydrolase/phosphoribosyl-ATP diphosphatase HisIE [Lachnospiraceae bacterium]
MEKELLIQLFIHNGEVFFDDEQQKPVSNLLPETIRHYGDVNADCILVNISALDDEGKEKSIHTLKEITKYSEIPVYAAFPIEREEDVKKILYADAKMAILNLSKQSNWDMLEDVSKRFGKEKIAVTFDDFSNLGVYRKMAETYSSACFIFNGVKPSDVAQSISLPLYVGLPNVTLEKLLDSLEGEYVAGVFGHVVNENASQINSIKLLCTERNIPVKALSAKIPWEKLRKNADGLIPVIAQDYKTGEVLMLAYMNEEAYLQTIKTGKMNYYSRSRKSQWEKGEESGHFQYVKSLYADCDFDTLLAKVSQIGVACHTGSPTCFFNEIAMKEYTEKNPLKVFEHVYGVIADRKVNPKEGSYTNYLFDKGIDKILKKVGEEASEIIIAAKNPDAGEIKYEISDFLYHCMVLMVERGISWEEICNELAARE